MKKDLFPHRLLPLSFALAAQLLLPLQALAACPTCQADSTRRLVGGCNIVLRDSTSTIACRFVDTYEIDCLTGEYIWYERELIDCWGIY